MDGRMNMLQAENVLFTIVLIGYFAATILNFAFVILKREKIAKAPVCRRDWRPAS